MKLRPSFYPLSATVVYLLLAQLAFAADKEVSFKTEDGRTIHGRLCLPDNLKEKVPAVMLLPSPAHDQSVFEGEGNTGQNQSPGLIPIITAKGVAALSFDFRGRGKSAGEMALRPALQRDSQKLYSMGVRAAMAFLIAQPEVDSSRLGVVAEEEGAEAGVAGWAGDSRVKAMALISGRLSGPAKESIASERDMPLFLIVSSEDKKGFADMTDAYFLSTNRESDIEVYRGLGSGTAMFKAFQSRFPNETPLEQTIGEWISDKLLSTGTLAEVSFQTEDGWTIYGNFRVPQNAPARVPAVILLHSGLSDRNAYHELEGALARSGLAVLNIDWRGKGKSTGKGKYFELSKAERDKGYLDAKAAVIFLTSQSGIDPDRLGIMGTVIGAKYAMAAAVDEPRIRTVVVLTGYIPTEKEKAYVSTQKLPILLVTSSGHKAVTQSLTELYSLAKGGGSELLVYKGGAIGYQLFEVDKDLLPRVVRWMKDKLSQQ
jgi:cephalosporin-C deacetylase-like acetyl esterase